MNDIETKKDIALLVDTFYNDVLRDDLLAPFFKSMDFDLHKPKMIQFWSFVLLDEAGYTTDVTKKHMHMKLSKEHFDRWLKLFNASLDQLFIGERAEAARQRAALINWTIQSKM
jgi:hemoglobin